MTNTNAPDRPPVYRLDEVAAILQVSRGTLYNWIREGRLTARKMGGGTFVLRSDFDALLENLPKVTLSPPRVRQRDKKTEAT